MSQSSILITGGFGFLGRAVGRVFRDKGFRVIGIGRGHWTSEDAEKHGFAAWLNAGVTLPSLMTLNTRFDLIVHCAGNGSVGYSLTNPLQDFNKTVQSTVDLLEYVRLSGTDPLIVYPSSAGVYGAVEDKPIKENDALNPISPYGFHKRITEELLASFSRSYGMKAAIIRFFSIYGPGLTKQLLWDASVKFREHSDRRAVFWGTGEETRDWIFIDDAAELIFAASKTKELFSIMNGASGIRTTVRETLQQLCTAMDIAPSFTFNNSVRPGDPRFYHADISRVSALGWRPGTSLHDGIRRYVGWLRAHAGNTD
jgi:UDP-glucose 4-epimerase